MKSILSENNLLNFKVRLAEEVRQKIEDNLSLMLSQINEQTEVKVQQRATLEGAAETLEQQIKTAVVDRETVKYVHRKKISQTVSFR